MAEQLFKLNNAAGPFPQGMILSRAQIEAANCDFDFWTRTRTISKATDDDAQVDDADRLLDDAAMKAAIESRIRDEGVTDPRKQDAIAAEVSRTWAEHRDARQARHVELAEAAGEARGGTQKPPKIGSPEARGATEIHVGGRPLSAFDGKTDDEIRKMVGGNEAGKAALLREVRDAQKLQANADPIGHRRGAEGGNLPASTNPAAHNQTAK